MRLPQIPALLDLSGAAVIIEAMGYQKAIAHQIIAKEADYVLTLKDNHPALSEEVRLWLDTEMAQGRLAVREAIDKGHETVWKFAAIR